MTQDNQYQKSADDLGNLAQAADENAALISRAFDKVGSDISKSLGSAARSGELSIKSLAQAILRDLSNIAINQYVTKPIEGIVSSIAANFGSRAGGGSVNTGGAYLVGENGPELFVPKTAGTIQNEMSQPININIHVGQGGNLSDVKRSANQISTALARAVNKGRGGL
jgi:phage-related minor tail protein